MELRWLGHACFTVTHNGYTLAIDPYNADYIPGYPKLRGVKADKLLISHDSYGHNYIPGIVLSGRPESDCPFTITPMEVWHDTVCGIMRGSCLIHLIEADGLRVAHMGDIGAPLTGEQLSKLYDPAMVRHYDTDRITITADMEPQIAVLKFLGPTEEEQGNIVKKSSVLSRAVSKLHISRRK